MSEEILSKEDLTKQIKRCPEWDIDGECIIRSWEFESFAEAIDFVNVVAEMSEEANHHPDILIRYNKVKLALSTREIGGVTEADLEMAVRIDHMSGDR